MPFTGNSEVVKVADPWDEGDLKAGLLHANSPAHNVAHF